jgi:hypothetical protein
MKDRHAENYRQTDRQKEEDRDLEKEIIQCRNLKSTQTHMHKHSQTNTNTHTHTEREREREREKQRKIDKEFGNIKYMICR